MLGRPIQVNGAFYSIKKRRVIKTYICVKVVTENLNLLKYLTFSLTFSHRPHSLGFHSNTKHV